MTHQSPQFAWGSLVVLPFLWVWTNTSKHIAIIIGTWCMVSPLFTSVSGRSVYVGGGGTYTHAYGDHRSTVNDVVPQEPFILSGSLIDLELTNYTVLEGQWVLHLPSTGTKRHLPPCLTGFGFCLFCFVLFILQGIWRIDLRSSCLPGKHFCQLS